MKERPVTVEISSSHIRVGGSSHVTSRIEQLHIIEVKTSAWRLITKGRPCAIYLTNFRGKEIFLLGSLDKDSLIKIYHKINEAIAECSRGRQFTTSVTINGDCINQNGFFGTGVNDGVMIG